jgi:hypothetical protein
MGDTMQKAAQRGTIPNRIRFPGQDEVGRLERILRIMDIPQHPHADPQDECAIPINDVGKCFGTKMVAKGCEQIAIRGTWRRLSLPIHAAYQCLQVD